MPRRRLFCSFDEWQATRMAWALSTNPIVQCPECEGNGIISCKECGHDRDCGACGTAGDVPYLRLRTGQREKVFSLDQYELAVLQDATALAAWIGHELKYVLREHGYDADTLLRRHRHELEAAA